MLWFLLFAIVAVYIIALGTVYKEQRRVVFRPQPPLNASNPGSYGTPFQEVSIPTPDGFTLNAWWLKHGDSDGHTLERRPTLFYCHGNAANLSLLSEVASIFYSLGWNALLFDYRAYGKSTGSPSDLSELALLTDAQAAYDWLKAEGIIEREVIVWGHSLGSSVATLHIGKNHPAALILEDPFPSVLSMARSAYPWLMLQDFMVWDKFETLPILRTSKIPKLIMHAERDEVVPIKLGQAVFAEASEPKEWILLHGIGHSDFPSVHKDYAGQLKGFAARALGLDR